MAYALALKSTFDFEKGPIMLVVTLIYAFISILGVGSLMNPILEKMEVNKKQPSVLVINGHVIKSLDSVANKDAGDVSIDGI